MPGASLPLPVHRALVKLGRDIREARIRRRISSELMAQRARVTRMTIYRIERGDAGVAMGTYATVLFILGLSDRLSEVADVRFDQTGLALAEEQLPKRVRVKGSKQTNG